MTACVSFPAPQPQGPKAAEATKATYSTTGAVLVGGNVVCGASFHKGYVVTAAHCAKEGEDVRVSTFVGYVAGSDPSFPCSVIYRSDEDDLAVLSVNGILPDGVGSVALGSSSDLLPGAEVATIGHPIRLMYSLSVGHISVPSRDLNGVKFVQADISMTHGNSGGPLFNRKGELVGVASSVIQSSLHENHLGFFVPVEKVKGVFK